MINTFLSRGYLFINIEHRTLAFHLGHTFVTYNNSLMKNKSYISCISQAVANRRVSQCLAADAVRAVVSDMPPGNQQAIRASRLGNADGMSIVGGCESFSENKKFCLSSLGKASMAVTCLIHFGWFQLHLRRSSPSPLLSALGPVLLWYTTRCA